MAMPAGWIDYGDERNMLPPGVQDTTYMRMVARQNIAMYSHSSSPIYRAIVNDAEHFLKAADRIDAEEAAKTDPILGGVLVILAIALIAMLCAAAGVFAPA